MEVHGNNRPTAERRSTAIAYRPRTFSELVGQEFVAHAITNALEQQSVAHAYLLCGPRGVGKTTTARLLAQYLNHGGESSDQQWEAIRNGSGLDVIEIDGASNTSVQDVRQIKENILYPPQASRYKIYIIDEVHMLSTSAFNALLKTIEEPPSYVVFIFATTESEKLPMTVRSRCQQFHFRLIPTDIIAKQLTEVAAKLNIAINQEVVNWIATEAQGSMRDAYTLFDQLSVLGDDLLDLDALRKHFGFAETKQLGELIVLLSRQEVAAAMKLFDTILNAGVSIESICNDMTQLYRALLMRNYNIEISNTEMIPSEIGSSLTAYTDSELLAIIEELVNVFQSLKDSLNPRFSCELALARIGYIRDRVTAQDIQSSLSKIPEVSSVMGGAPQPVDSAQTANVATTPTFNGTTSRLVGTTPTQIASAEGLAAENGADSELRATDTKPTATLDPLMQHTPESLRTELNKDTNGGLSSHTHTSTASTEQHLAPSENGEEVTIPFTSNSTFVNVNEEQVVSHYTDVRPGAPTNNAPSHKPPENSVSSNKPPTDNTSPNYETTNTGAPPSIDARQDQSNRSRVPTTVPTTNLNELSIDEISQVVKEVTTDKPIIHNLLVHDCTWKMHQDTVTIAVPTEFDKTTLVPYHSALTEVARAKWGQRYTVALTIAAKDSNTDKLISMTKKMFNAVE